MNKKTYLLLLTFLISISTSPSYGKESHCEISYTAQLRYAFNNPTLNGSGQEFNNINYPKCKEKALIEAEKLKKILLSVSKINDLFQLTGISAEIKYDNGKETTQEIIEFHNN